jgi:hypothetical protein
MTWMGLARRAEAPAIEEGQRCGTTHHPKTVVVVTVVRIVVVAVRRAGIVLIIVERPAPQNPVVITGNPTAG